MPIFLLQMLDVCWFAWICPHCFSEPSGQHEDFSKIFNQIIYDICLIFSILRREEIQDQLVDGLYTRIPLFIHNVSQSPIVTSWCRMACPSTAKITGSIARLIIVGYIYIHSTYYFLIILHISFVGYISYIYNTLLIPHYYSCFMFFPYLG
jgi:hypothetical protein